MRDLYIENLIQRERLPEGFIEVVDTVYLPIAEKLETEAKGKPQGHIIGINGCPGSGKSTMALFLKAILESKYELSVAIISIDDFYKTKQEREQLAIELHPLFKTRGVPGTHDIELANNTLGALSTATKQSPCLIPRFDKSKDDRYPINDWDAVLAAPDIIILEGWCVAVTAQKDEDLEPSINSLEQEQDADARWRKAVNSNIHGSYQGLFSKLEYLIVLQAATPEVVLKWRIEQEEKLRKSVAAEASHSNGAGNPGNTSPIGMSNQQLEKFVMHYERLIRHMHQNLPQLADIVVELDQQRGINNLLIK